MPRCPIRENTRDATTYKIAADWWEEQGHKIMARIKRAMAYRIEVMKDLDLKPGDEVYFYSTTNLAKAKVVGVGTTAVNVRRSGRRNKEWVDALLIMGKVKDMEAAAEFERS